MNRFASLGALAGASLSAAALIAGATAVAAVVLPAQNSTAAATFTRTQPIGVKSTLAGRHVLPHRVVWQAFPGIPASQVKEVDFLIDGKLRWVEHHPTYVYGGLDYSGYLVTSWLAPGLHRFTVLVRGIGGRSGTEAVRARVEAAPDPPATLAGTWTRTIDTSSAPKPGSSGNPTDTITPSGSYTMTFEKRWIRDQFPGQWQYPQSNQTGEGLYNFDDYTAGPGRIHVVGEVVFHPFSDQLPEGGSWCYFYGPPATYDWTVNGNTLTLSPVGGHDACGIRGFIWTGDWTRVG